MPRNSRPVPTYNLLIEFLSYCVPFHAALAEADSDNFYMEREWRTIGDVDFPWRTCVANNDGLHIFLSLNTKISNLKKVPSDEKYLRFVAGGYRIRSSRSAMGIAAKGAIDAGILKRRWIAFAERSKSNPSSALARNYPGLLTKTAPGSPPPAG